MDFETPASVLPLLDEVNAFVRDRLLPLEKTALKGSFKDALPRLLPLREEAKARGIFGPQLPKDLGGRGLSVLDLAFVSEALGRSPLGH
jgi:alkylation response protein AidB-like acyl-CoA dehydrogenase